MSLIAQCQGCKKYADQITEYIMEAREEGISPDLWVAENEGTYNDRNGHFLCTKCYIEAGMPSAPDGWVAA